MPKYKVISGFCLSGVGDVFPGTIVDLEPRQAARELHIGRVVEYVEDLGDAVGVAVTTSASSEVINTKKKARM